MTRASDCQVLRVRRASRRRRRGASAASCTAGCVFFAVILGVFSSLWRAVAEAGMPIAADPKALVWYLAATEWIMLSAPPIHLEIQEAIRRGDVVYRLGRPVLVRGRSSSPKRFGCSRVRAPAAGG